MTPTPLVWLGDVDASGRLRLDRRPAFVRHLHTLAGQRVEVIVRPRTKRRSLAQNARYWALLTVAAESLGWGAEARQDLHEEVAFRLLALPPCAKTGLRRRKRTPKLGTAEFGRYMDDVVRLLLEFGADLSEWDAEEQRLHDLVTD